MLLLREKSGSDAAHSRLTGDWDCHVHVFGPRGIYPLTLDRRYTPGLADKSSLLAHAHRIGSDHVVLVQPSAYGHDNRCLLDALDAIGSCARAVVVLNPEEIDDDRLASLHALGARGVRINPSGGIQRLAQAEDAIKKTTARLAGTDWHIEVNCAPSLTRPIANLCSAAGLPVVYAHLLGLDPSDPDFNELAADAVTLAREEPIWIKLSGPDRVCRTPHNQARWAEAALALAGAAPDRVLWGSDWPHTPIEDGDGGAFRMIDDPGQLVWINAMMTEAASTLLMRVNPARLYA